MLIVNILKQEIEKVKSDLLSFAFSDYGKRHILSLSILDSSLMENEIERVKKTYRLLSIYLNIYPSHIPFIDELIKKIEKDSSITEEEMGKIFLVFITVKNLINLLISNNILDILCLKIDNYPVFLQILDKLSLFFDNTGIIKVEATPILHQINIEKEQVRNNIHKIIEDFFINKGKFLQEKFFVFRDGRYVLPIKANFRKEINGIVRDASQSGDTFFIEPIKLVELNDQLFLLQKKEEQEKNKILKLLSTEIKSISNILLNILSFYGYWESLVVRAIYMQKFNLNFPAFNKNEIIIKNAIHPMLITKNPIPNDIVLDNGKNLLLLTGPNGGGKTVTLKTIASIYALTYMAIPTPIEDSSSIKIFKKLFFDIEDIQDVEKGVSSFTSRMILWKDILSQADEHTLVIIDEMGSFTNPQEGAAISCAFLSELIKKGATVIAGTHLDQIKEFFVNVKEAQVASFLWDTKTMKPTFRIVYGSVAASYAINVVESLGFDKEFVHSCYSFLNKDFINLKNMQEKYQKKLYELHKNMEEVEALKKELKKTTLEKQELYKTIRHKLLDLQKTYKEKIENLLKVYEDKIAENDKDKKSMVYMKTKFEEEANKVSLYLNPLMPKLKKYFQKGDKIFIPSILKEGKVLEIYDEKVLVIIDNKKFCLPKTTIYDAIDNKSELKKSKLALYQNHHYINYNEELIIDLKGKRVEEAIEILQKNIDEAYLKGIRKIKVIHGAGKGNLRKGIQDYLATCELIKNFHQGDYLEKGGSYYTRAELR